MATILQSSLGIAVFILAAWAWSENRSSIPWRAVVGGLLMQFLLAVLLLKVPPFKDLFIAVNHVLASVEEATRAGTSFVFGYLGGAPLPFAEGTVGTTFILAFRALPLILVVSALSALLFHWRILPAVVTLVSQLLQRAMGVGGALGLGAAANIFVGMVEAPLFVRPYLLEMSRGELFALMSCGMATIAGTVMVLYASILGPVVPDALGHILTASLISAPAALLVAFLMVPPQQTMKAGVPAPPPQANGSMDAITQGTLHGVQLLINVVAMLVVLIALVSLVNLFLGMLPDVDGTALTLQRILGWVMAPVAWLIGIPWSEVQTAGALLGTKTVLNELLAYLDLASLPSDALSPRSRTLMTYAMCGFANLGSLGIMIGGLGTMVPERRGEIVELGFKSIFAGTLATLMTGAVAGIML